MLSKCVVGSSKIIISGSLNIALAIEILWVYKNFVFLLMMIFPQHHQISTLLSAASTIIHRKNIYCQQEVRKK